MSVLGIFDNSVAELVPGATDWRNSITTNYVDITYTRGAINITSSAPTVDEPLLAADCVPWEHDTGADVIWLHFHMPIARSRAFPDTLLLCASDYTPIYSIRNSSTYNSTRIKWQAWNDAGAVASSEEVYYFGGSTTPTPADWDFRIDRTNLTLQVYRDGNLEYSTTLVPSRTANTQVSKICLGWAVPQYSGYGTDTSQNITEVILADERTIGWHLYQLGPNAAGTLADGLADYTTIDEIGFSTSDVNSLAAAGSQTFGYEDMVDIEAGLLEVKSVCMGTAANATAGASAPVLTNQAYIGGVAYDMGSGVDVTDNNFEFPVVANVATNPATGLRWTYTEINAAEFGYKTSV